MKNSFGNYVVQKALKLCTGFLKVKLTNNIKKNIEKINDKKLVSKWKSILTTSTTNVLSFNNNQGFGTQSHSSGYDTNSPNNSFNTYNSYNSFGSYVGTNNISPTMSPVNFTNQI